MEARKAPSYMTGLRAPGPECPPEHLAHFLSQLLLVTQECGILHDVFGMIHFSSKHKIQEVIFSTKKNPFPVLLVHWIEICPDQDGANESPSLQT